MRSFYTYTKDTNTPLEIVPYCGTIKLHFNKITEICIDTHKPSIIITYNDQNIKMPHNGCFNYKQYMLYWIIPSFDKINDVSFSSNYTNKNLPEIEDKLFIEIEINYTVYVFKVELH
jgi:hypothetical protein